MHGVFSELSVVIIITAIVSLVMKQLRQPLILGYILAGLIVGPSALALIHSVESFKAFSEIGIALLLFIIGLGMNVSELRRLGKVVLIIASLTLTGVGLTGVAVSMLLGFSRSEALIVGLALYFSSTIIIVKILSDKKEQNRLHGQIAIGVILVEDLVATLALLFIAAGKDGGLDATQVGLLLGKGALLISALVLCSTRILPKVSKFIASSQELLFLFAIAWGFGIATLFEVVGFSIEVGALFAGVALASSPYSQQIVSRLKPLRDFFIVLFFITLGQGMNLSNLSAAILPAIALSLVVIILKPFVVISAMGLLGYGKRVSFKTGINLSQISEFSIVFVVLATSIGLVSNEVSAVITLVAIITIATSTYLMKYDDELFSRFDKIKLKVFEKERKVKEKHGRKESYDLVLVGFHRGGHEFLHVFRSLKKRYVVVDYDPHRIESLESEGEPNIYGDVTDPELLEEILLDRSELVVSTITELSVNLYLGQWLEKNNPNAVYIVTANSALEAIELYTAGASYVVLPHYIGSEKISHFLSKSGLKKSEFKKYKNKHLSYLEAQANHEESAERKQIGQGMLEKMVEIANKSLNTKPKN
ncbi:MAG: cation:proton antiporter [bacterium]|nr:cation:proton antiporter [bacterium]